MLFVFFWVIPRRLIYQTPGNHPKENKQHSEHGESLKSRIICLILPLLCLTELLPPFISQTLRDGTPQVHSLCGSNNNASCTVYLVVSGISVLLCW